MHKHIFIYSEFNLKKSSLLYIDKNLEDLSDRQGTTSYALISFLSSFRYYIQGHLIKYNAYYEACIIEFLKDLISWYLQRRKSEIKFIFAFYTK